MGELSEVRRGRNFIRVGERHRVIAGGAERTGFDLRITRIYSYVDGSIVVTGTVCRPHKHAGKTKSVGIERVVRKAQTKGGEPL